MSRFHPGMPAMSIHLLCLWVTDQGIRWKVQDKETVKVMMTEMMAAMRKETEMGWDLDMAFSEFSTPVAGHLSRVHSFHSHC